MATSIDLFKGLINSNSSGTVYNIKLVSRNTGGIYNLLPTC